MNMPRDSCPIKKFYFPNDLIVRAPNKSDRACFPPSGYLTIYEISRITFISKWLYIRTRDPSKSWASEFSL
ncbi:hypothetical protein IEQ34_005024 [Dendrobium chrysotoxum]|uniref:Uncharacterized protein n=1 Tax=Dendrobium chrysotoxum TaxID=161865 RepID=A0AAV7H7Q5_DENCH|nr:hypothetical protein IEQ34_005024 [Dendrobium chrysotoxum]